MDAEEQQQVGDPPGDEEPPREAVAPTPAEGDPGDPPERTANGPRLRPRRPAGRSRFEVGWQDWAVALALGAIVLLLGALALELWGGWSRQRDVARAMEPPPVAPPVRAPAAPPRPATPPASQDAARRSAPRSFAPPAGH